MSTLDCDVCIVGAGAAGLAIAHTLRGKRVVVVESGPLDDPASLNAGEVVGLPYNGLLRGRYRGVGGTTTVWPGQCNRLRTTDLARWPLPAGALDRWYEDAERLLGLVPGETERDPWELFGEPDPGIDPSRLVATTTVFAAKRDFSQLDVGDADVLQGTTATRVEDGLVETNDGRRIRAAAVVLCGGALESTRVLLASGFTQPALGRTFQDHAGFRPARVIGAPARRLQDRWGMRFRDGRRYAPKLLLANASPGGVANIVSEYGDESPFEAALRLRRALRLHRPPAASDLRRTLVGAPHLAAAAAGDARGRDPALPPDAVRVLAVVDQVPLADSRLTLADERDPLGMPRLRVDWRLGDDVGRTLVELVGTVDAELRRTGAGALEPEPWVGTDAWREHVFDVFHPAGSARMGGDGVVDGDCRVHGTQGLFVCGSAVFPTQGVASPTLTIVALALRLADHLA